LSVPLDALKKKHFVLCDELALVKLMKYLGFEKREELLDFLKSQHIHD
jgi:hypothetical protein